MQYAFRAQQLVGQARELGQSAIPLFTQQESRNQMQLLLNHVNDYQLLLQQLSAYGEQTAQSIILDTETKMTAAAREADAAGTRSVEQQLTVLQQESDELEQVIIIASVIAIVLSFIAASVITKLVTAPLQHILLVVGKIAEGDLTADLPSERQDEVGKLMAAMQKIWSRKIPTCCATLLRGFEAMALRKPMM